MFFPFTELLLIILECSWETESFIIIMLAVVDVTENYNKFEL